MKHLLTGLAIVAAMTACNSNSNKEAEIQREKQYTIDSMKQAAALQDAEAKNTVSSKTTTRHYSSGSARSGNGTYRGYSEPATLPTAKTNTDRPGWSNKAKGAVIGGVVGAVTGAAVSKDKKGKGAVIGGVVGAAGGYGVGAILDKKKKNQ
jgi:hypothetical protein